ncbi:MAG TPA: NAD(P)-dependent oxidoreductase [Candidatus Eisenbacteria bacterium]|nr:NAD(P)-dependent oxidoreductase [Candidatus Eisenbacteria bacterium]
MDHPKHQGPDVRPSGRNGRPATLVTGASGFVGGRVVARLLENGIPVRAIVRETAEPPADGRIDVVRGDFVDPDTARKAVAGAIEVIHCAATAGPEIEPVRRVNLDGTQALVDAALEREGTRFIQISTISVYDREGRSAIDEDSPLKTSGDPYGWTKAEADRAVLDAMKRGLRATILRPGAILGSGPTSTWGTRMPQMVLDGKVKLRRDGGDTIPFVHVEDLVDAVMLALHSDRAVGRVYNVADESHTWREYTDEIRRWFDLPELERVPDAEIQPGAYWVGTVSTERIRRELGFAPSRSYRDGMDEAERAWRERRATTRQD